MGAEGRNTQSPISSRLFRPVESVQVAIQDVKESEFVALDFEFLNIDSAFRCRGKTATEWLKDAARDVHRHPVVQMGVCCVKRSKSNPDHWSLTPHAFYAWPAEHIRTGDINHSCVLFLHENGFSFDQWLRERILFMRSRELADNANRRKALDLEERRSAEVQYAEWLRTRGAAPSGTDPSSVSNGNSGFGVEWNVVNCGLQNIISAITAHKIPVVLHNGAIDLLHLVDKFVAGINPDNYEAQAEEEGRTNGWVVEFCKNVTDEFAGGIHDTKLIMTAAQTSVFHQATVGGVRLYDLFLSMTSKPTKLKCEVVTTSFTSNSNDAGGPTEIQLLRTEDPTYFKRTACHDAGYDAAITARLFLAMLERLEASKLEGNGEKPATPSTPAIPRDWRELELIKAARWAVNIQSLGPGFLDMQRVAMGGREGEHDAAEGNAPQQQHTNSSSEGNPSFEEQQNWTSSEEEQADQSPSSDDSSLPSITHTASSSIGHTKSRKLKSTQSSMKTASPTRGDVQSTLRDSETSDSDAASVRPATKEVPSSPKRKRVHRQKQPPPRRARHSKEVLRTLGALQNNREKLYRHLKDSEGGACDVR